MKNDLTNAPLGKNSAYIDTYMPSLLFPLPRLEKRNELGICVKKLPFIGVDRWMGYELSWLDIKGKPQVFVVEFIFDCNSKYLIESKSFKLYLNSFNNSKFSSSQEVLACLKKDLTSACQYNVDVRILPEGSLYNTKIGSLSGKCLDLMDVECNDYIVNSELIKLDSQEMIHETLYSNLLKSNCLVTGQPDWGSVWIDYKGAKIDHASLLKYIISFRNHNEFHEQCVERIFIDIMKQAKPEQLSVYACYTRRGGLDINPFRSTHLARPPVMGRLFRQ